jgi:hypothetical protein
MQDLRNLAKRLHHDFLIVGEHGLIRVFRLALSRRQRTTMKYRHCNTADQTPYGRRWAAEQPASADHSSQVERG